VEGTRSHFLRPATSGYAPSGYPKGTGHDGRLEVSTPDAVRGIYYDYVRR